MMALASKTVASPAAFPAFSSIKDLATQVGFNGVLFGPPGVGKTTFISGFSRLGPMLLFDTDLGRESIIDVDNLFVAQNPDGSKMTWDQLRGYLDTALALRDESPYKTYGFDSLSSIYYELLIPKVVGSETKKVEWPHYSEAQRLLTKFIRDAKSLCEYGINTVFTGHVKEESDGEVVNIRLALPQGVRNEILLAVNHVGYLQRAKNSETRELHFTPPRRVDGPKLRQTRTGKQAPLILTDPDASSLLDSLRKNNA